MSDLKETIARLLPNGLGARGDEEKNPVLYPARSLHVLVAVSGSVASIKAPLIVRELRKHKNVDVQVIATGAAQHFFSKQEIEQEHDGQVRVWTDFDEWDGWAEIGDPILHIELRRWADVVLIAPLSANTLAKIANGICDNLLTSFLRALPSFVPVRVYPAMNTHMYSHPLTSKQLTIIKDELGYKVGGPISKMLACGDLGVGAMQEWSTIVAELVAEYDLQSKQQ